MKAYYICDRKHGCRWSDACGNYCKWTTDPKHAKNKNKRERFFVVDPNTRKLEEVETLQDMKERAQVIRDIVAIIENMSHNVTPESDIL